MSIEVKFRRGTTAEHASFTGADGEVTVDTDKETLVVHDGSTAGGFPLAREDRNQRTIDPFKPGTHSGLDFAYGVGIAREDNVVARVNAGTVTLTDDTTNYIESTAAGVVSANTTGFTAGRIPLFTVTTVSGAITAVQDDRCFFNAGGGNGFVGVKLIARVAPPNYALAALSSLNISVPATVESGDLMVIYAAHRDVITLPEGWTEAVEQQCYFNGTTYQWSSIWYKIADGDDAESTVTVSQDSEVLMTAAMAVFRGSSAFQLESATGNTVNGYTMPTITASADDCVAVAVSSNVFASTSGGSMYYHIWGHKWSTLDTGLYIASKRITASWASLGAETLPASLYNYVSATDNKMVGNAVAIFKLS